jgi:Zn-finger nucleic acid-binding protein
MQPGRRATNGWLGLTNGAREVTLRSVPMRGVSPRRAALELIGMNCPACGNELAPITAGAVTVDVCQAGCHGIWFDAFELKRSSAQPESARRELMHLNRPPAEPVDPKPKRPCPRCPDIVMMRRFFSARRLVEVDECPNCGGLWLDGGELSRIRSEAVETESEARQDRGATMRLVYRYLCKVRVD